MRKLTDEEVCKAAEWMDMPVKRVREYVDLMFSEKKKGNYRLKHTKLDSADDYCEERDMLWYFYPDWKALVESEMDQGEEGLTEQECREGIGESIFQLSDGWYVQTLY